MTHEASTGAMSGETLPEEQGDLLRKAIRLERITLVVLLFNVTLVGLASGQSQAMKAAWYEDMLSFLPPIAFLIASRVIRRKPDLNHPYGHHHAIGVGHLVAAAALLAMGAFVLITSVMGLFKVEKPPIGLVVLFGQYIWMGWIMVAVMAITAIGPVILGRLKIKLAKPLHDKLLYADADMNKADWMTSVSTIVGVLGVGAGLWWMDGVAATIVALSIVYDGITNLRTAILDLTDARATTLDGEIQPVIAQVEEVARSTQWVDTTAARVRDVGHVFHVELFVVPRPGQEPSLAELEALKRELHEIDYKVHDLVIVPVSELPVYMLSDDW